MKIPSRKDWGNINKNDLDAEWAFEQFFGKTFEEAKAMFKDNALYYQEGLQSMPSKPFNFYAPALVNYITSDQAECDSDGASSFLRMVAWMLKTQYSIILPETKKSLVDAVALVSKNQKFYDADIDIYGDFSETYAEIVKRADGN